MGWQCSTMTDEPIGAGSAEKYDPLTNLFTLSYFVSTLHAGKAGVLSGPCSLVYINVPNFKAFNKTYGFLSGDEFLKQLGAAIRTAFPDDLVCRESADRFMVFLRDIDKERIIRSVETVQKTMTEYRHGITLF